MTAANAPFTARSVPPFASTAVASDIFVAGSNGTNLVSFGGLAVLFLAAAARMAVSTGSCPPSELARAAMRQHVRLVEAGLRTNGSDRQFVAS